MHKRYALILTTLGITVATVLAAAASVLSSGLIDRAAAGQPKFVPGPAAGNSGPDVPEPPPLQPLRLAIRATNISWVTACADCTKVLERLFQNGDAIEIPFSKTAILRSGNAGGLEVTLAGQSFQPMGPWGATLMLQATPDGYDYVTPVLTNPCVPR